MGAPQFLDVHRLGHAKYRAVWDEQRAIQTKLITGDAPATLLLCEHEPVITLGRSAQRKHVRASDEALAALAIDCIEIERGGDVTYHGPGQLVAYPLLDLRKFRTDVGWYLRLLEQCIIDTLEHFGVPGVRLAGKTGVWVVNSQPQQPNERKIASIGVRLSRWCTLHGLAINIRSCSDGFSLIDPCGMEGIRVTSVVEECGSAPEVSEFAEIFIDKFCSHFGLLEGQTTAKSGDARDSFGAQ